jgi:tetratricopeptide (TPR) repeat protein
VDEAEKLGRLAMDLMETNPAQSVALLTRALALTPDDDRIIYNRVVAYARAGREADALADLTRLETLKPLLGQKLRAELALGAGPYTDLARHEYARGHFEVAIRKCESALAFAPHWADAWLLKGMALRQMKQFEKALECYNQAVSLEPAGYCALLERAEVHRQLGRMAEAVADLSRAAEVKPDQAELGKPGLPERDNRQSVELKAVFAHGPFFSIAELGCSPPTQAVDCDVEAVERAVGVRLPDGYRKFLERFGGWWGDLVCACQEPTPFGQDHCIAGFCDAGGVLNLLESRVTPPNIISFGYGHFEKYTCLSVAGIDRGVVYAADGEARSSWSDEEFHQRFNGMADSIRDFLRLRREGKLRKKPPGYENLYLLAQDFDEFLSSCRPDTG